MFATQPSRNFLYDTQSIHIMFISSMEVDQYFRIEIFHGIFHGIFHRIDRLHYGKTYVPVDFYVLQTTRGVVYTSGGRYIKNGSALHKKENI